MHYYSSSSNRHHAGNGIWSGAPKLAQDRSLLIFFQPAPKLTLSVTGGGGS